MTGRSSFSRPLRLAAALGAAGWAATSLAADTPALSPLDAFLAEAAPRHFAELTPDERAALLRDPRLRDFLAARASPAPSPARPPASALILAPGEILRREPWRTPLPPP